MKIDGQVAVITGGAQGLGKCYARELLQKGAKVCILDINDAKGKQTEEEMQKIWPRKIIYKHCDVTNDNILEAVNQIESYFSSRIKIWVNNAGLLSAGKEFQNVIHVNLIALMKCTYIIIEHMALDNPKTEKGQGGVIVNISSIAGIEVIGGAPEYSASKFGVIGFTQSLALQLSSTRSECGVRLCCLLPPFVETDLTKDIVIEKIPPQSSFHEIFSKYEGWNAETDVANGLLSLIERDDSHNVMLIPTKTGKKKVVIEIHQEDW